MHCKALQWFAMVVSKLCALWCFVVLCGNVVEGLQSIAVHAVHCGNATEGLQTTVVHCGTLQCIVVQVAYFAVECITY